MTMTSKSNQSPTTTALMPKYIQDMHVNMMKDVLLMSLDQQKPHSSQ